MSSLWSRRCRLALFLIVALVCLQLWSASRTLPQSSTPKYDQQHRNLLQAYKASRTKKKHDNIINLPSNDSSLFDGSKPKSSFFKSSDLGGHIRIPDEIKDSDHGVTELDDIFIAIKSTYMYHRTRLPLLMNTWIPLARQSVSEI